MTVTINLQPLPLDQWEVKVVDNLVLIAMHTNQGTLWWTKFDLADGKYCPPVGIDINVSVVGDLSAITKFQEAVWAAVNEGIKRRAISL